MGLSGLIGTGDRAGHFRHIVTGLGTHPRGTPESTAEAFLKTTGADPQAMLPLLDSFVDTSEAELRRIATPILVIAGEADDDNGSASALAETLADGRFVSVPGTHMSAVLRPELSQAMAAFLA
jgi:pimeloyl-ACP methyl ester carboxylesterase